MALARTGGDRFDGILRQADKQTNRQADKQTSRQADERQAGENGSGGYRAENRVAMGAKKILLIKVCCLA